MSKRNRNKNTPRRDRKIAVAVQRRITKALRKRARGLPLTPKQHHLLAKHGH